MPPYQRVNVKLSNSQVDKLQSATEIVTDITLIISQKHDWHEWN